jgi:hypothetical protein
VFGGVVRGAAGQPDQPAEGGTVDDGAAALGAYLSSCFMQAGPDPAITCSGFPDTDSEAMIVSERSPSSACTETTGVPSTGC